MEGRIPPYIRYYDPPDYDSSTAPSPAPIPLGTNYDIPVLSAIPESDVIVAEALDIDMKISESEFKMKGEIIKLQNRLGKIERDVGLCCPDYDKLTTNIQSRFRGNKDRERHGTLAWQQVTMGWVIIKDAQWGFGGGSMAPITAFPVGTAEKGSAEAERLRLSRRPDARSALDWVEQTGEIHENHRFWITHALAQRQLSADRRSWTGSQYPELRDSSPIHPWPRIENMKDKSIFGFWRGAPGTAEGGYDGGIVETRDNLEIILQEFITKPYLQQNRALAEGAGPGNSWWLCDFYVAPGTSLQLIKIKKDEGFTIEFENENDKKKVEAMKGGGYKNKKSKKKKSKKKKTKKKKTRRKSKRVH